jgi:hypothetical protein
MKFFEKWLESDTFVREYYHLKTEVHSYQHYDTNYPVTKVEPRTIETYEMYEITIKEYKKHVDVLIGYSLPSISCGGSLNTPYLHQTIYDLDCDKIKSLYNKVVQERREWYEGLGRDSKIRAENYLASVIDRKPHEQKLKECFGD